MHNAGLYRNNLKNRVYAKEAAQIFVSGARDIARGKNRSEDQKCAAKPTPAETDSSGCFGIKVVCTNKSNVLI